MTTQASSPWTCLLVWTALSSLLATKALTGAVLVCNGHGTARGGPGNSTLCVCQEPYTGDTCQTCNHGYYGNPINGGLCYLSCGRSKHLTHFTTGGVGVSSQHLLDNPPKSGGNVCLWIIDPFHLNPFDDSQTHNNSNNNASLRFQISTNPSSLNKTLLIYRGLPSFLNFALSNSILYNQSVLTHQSQLNQNSISTTNIRANLFLSLTGDRLLDNPLVVVNGYDVVTLVYLYHGTGMDRAALNVSVTVWNGDNSSDLNQTPYDVIAGEIPSLRPHLLVSSLSKLLSQQFIHYPSNQNQDANLTSNSTLNKNYSYPDCSGRYWHSSVYDTNSELLWLLGGLDLEGVVCRGLVAVNTSLVTMDTSCEGCVWRVRSDGVEPDGRYLHTAVATPCPNATVGGCMLVFGGFPSVGDLSTPSSELWLYNHPLHSWTVLQDSPISLAAHSAVATGNGSMLVVGGVKDEQISSEVMSYDLHSNHWEPWSRTNMPGMYGHSAVYDASTHSVYLFGGVVYSRPVADLSNSLYVINVATRNWAKVILSTEPPGRLFHAMLLLNHTLYISGGLTKPHPLATPTPYPGLAGLAAANNSILIDLTSQCNTGKTVLIADQDIRLWGHSIVTYIEYNTTIIVSGGFNSAPVDSIFTIEPPIFSCSIAQTLEACQLLPFCESCVVNVTTFIGCYHSNESWLCSDTLIESTNNCTVSTTEVCSQFSNCLECLSADVAQDNGCIWNGCFGICTDNSTSNVSCSRTASNYNDQFSVCPVDACVSASCQECVSDPICGWSFIKIQPNILQTTIIITGREWGCYRNGINSIVSNEILRSATIATCPSPCNFARTCHECVQSRASAAGPLNCVWETYSQMCIQQDVAPLICAGGLCGGYVTNNNQEQCPLPCSAHLDCTSCQTDPKCSWYLGFTDNKIVGYCTDELRSLDTLSTLVDDLYSTFELRQYYTTECPGCADNCNGRGVCVISALSCDCDLGYIGEQCSVECGCNQLSYCANSSVPGRNTCLQCRLNTQGSDCGQCRPFSVGSPGNGTGCVPCRQHCHGNSDLCVRRLEFREAMERNISLDRAGFDSFVTSGPDETEAVCAECEGGATGELCDSCRPGYYDDNFSGQSTRCVECQCNGHGPCHPVTGACSCQNQTTTCDGCSINIQCSACVAGYIGAPSNNNQCYKQLSINQIANFIILPRQSIALAIGLDYIASNVDVTVHFVRQFGDMTIYDALNNRAVSVTVDADTFQHMANIRTAFQVTRVRKQVVSKRQAEGVLGISDVFVRDFSTDNQLALVISHEQTDFQSLQHFLTIVTGPLGAQFYIYYDQEVAQLNYFVFSSILLSCFFLTFAIALFIWKAIKIEIRRRARVNNRRLREARANRPFAKVKVYFDRKKLIDWNKSNPLLLLKEPLKETSFVGVALHTTKEEAIALQTTNLPTKKYRKRDMKRIVEPGCIEPWPIAQEVCNDGGVSVSTVLVKLPTRSKVSKAHVLNTGTCLVHRPKVEEAKRWKRNNRCMPVETATQL